MDYLNQFRLDGRTAFITGAGRGIGLCTADALAQAGANIIISGIDQADLDTAADQLRAKGHNVRAMLLDVTNSAATTEIADKLAGDGTMVDILIANAGIAWADTKAEDIDDAAWAKVLDVNLTGAFYSCRALAATCCNVGAGPLSRSAPCRVLFPTSRKIRCITMRQRRACII